MPPEDQLVQQSLPLCYWAKCGKRHFDDPDANRPPMSAWVRSGHCGPLWPCPLHPQERTNSEAVGLSAKCHVWTAPTPADVAVQVWLKAPDVVRERHAENIAYRQRHFLYYGGVHGTERTFPAIEERLREQIEATLDDWFESRQRGRGCRIFFFRHDHLVWILVRHGLHMRREASHLEDGQPSFQVYRPQRHDVLIYDTTTDEIGVHADTKGEIKLYLRRGQPLLHGIHFVEVGTSREL
jgi:hypothetical protein